jgi:hypothetical protein
MPFDGSAWSLQPLPGRGSRNDPSARSWVSVMSRIGSVSLLAIPIGLVQAWTLDGTLKDGLAWGVIVGGATFLTVAGYRLGYPALVSLSLKSQVFSRKHQR